MVLHFDIAPERCAYFPGEVITAAAEICNLPGTSPSATDSASITVVEVTVQVLGTELVDPAYISNSYHHDLPAHTVRNSRRLSRQVFKTARAPLGEPCVLHPGDRKEFQMRFLLPDQLPPTFKGASLRFDYAFEAEAQYVVGMSPSTCNGTASATVAVADTPSSLQQPSRTDTALGSSDVPANTGMAASEQAATAGTPQSAAGAPQPSGAQPQEHPTSATHTLMQSMLLKVPLQIWPLDGIERSQSAPFLAGSEADVGMPSVVYELGCPGYDLTLHVEELLSESVSNDRLTVGLAATPSGRQQSASKATTRHNRHSLGVVQAIQNGKILVDETADPLLEDVAQSPLLGSTSDPTRRMSRWTTTEGAVALPSLIKVFNIRVGDDPLVRLCLHPPLEGALMPGGTLMGTLDFRASHQANARSKSSPKCIMLSVTLETEEVVAEKWLVPSRSGTIRKIYDEHVELTPDTLISHFAFTIPRDSPPSFSLPVATLRWLLRFEYNIEADTSSWTRSTQQTQLLWKLPVLVRPPT